MTTYRGLTIQGQRYLLVEDYRLPNSVVHLYNTRGPFPILICVDGTPSMYVPSWFQCFAGDPIHLNQPAPFHLAVNGWKWACMIVSEWDNSKYSGRALMKLIDNFFRNYPSTG
jgi:hypothetical protein